MTDLGGAPASGTRTAEPMFLSLVEEHMWKSARWQQLVTAGEPHDFACRRVDREWRAKQRLHVVTAALDELDRIEGLA